MLSSLWVVEVSRPGGSHPPASFRVQTMARSGLAGVLLLTAASLLVAKAQQIAVSNTATCVILRDLRLACFGGVPGVANVPAGQFAQVCGGSDYFCALSLSGSIHVW